MTRVAISVVTHNNAGCLPQFVKSLNAQRDVDFEIYFLDNASSDNTLALLQKSGPLNVHASETNLGYARGHNVNLARSNSKYFITLNADLRFEPDLLRRLATHLDAHHDEAIVGPAVFEGRESKPFPPRQFYPGEGMIPIEPGLHRDEIAWVNGCCMMIRRDALQAVGGFDEDYFLYQAETDLCLRVRREGHRIGYCDEAVVHHLHRQSQRDITEYEYGRRLFEGSAVFWRKHYTPADVAAIARFQYRASGLFLMFGNALEKLTNRPALGRERLRARRHICGELMQSPDLQGMPGRWRPIVRRQSQLALDWIRHREISLDDY